MNTERTTLELRGAEVVLRPLRTEDAELLAVAAGESRDHFGFTPVPDGPEEAAQYVARLLRFRDGGRELPFTILWQGRVVGTTSYLSMETWAWPPGHPQQRTDRPDVLEIGRTWLAQSAQRTRCNTEAKLLLLAHAFDVWEVHRVSLRTDERNERSRRAIERLGARFEGVRRADMPGSDGTVRNSAYYSLVRAEWPDVRSRLEAFLNPPSADPSPPTGDASPSSASISAV